MSFLNKILKYCILSLLRLDRFSEGILINISSKKNAFVRVFTPTIHHFETGLFKKSGKIGQCQAPARYEIRQWGGLPRLSCKRDHIKMRDYMDRRVTPPKRVTSPTRGPSPAGKPALSYKTSVTVNHHIYFVLQPLYGFLQKM